MKFGVFSLMQWPEDRSQEGIYRIELEQLSSAETEGYDSVWLAEHHFSRYGIGPAIHLSAAHLAAKTQSIRIGTAITILPSMHPIRTAEEIAMLDLLSEGRIEWGIGPGYQKHEFDGFRVDIQESHLLFREQLEIILEAWTGERFSYQGEHYQIPELQCFPTPVQQPHPPIWIAALSPSTLEWAATHNYPVLTDPFTPTSRIEENRLRYRQAASQAGHDSAGFSFPTLRHVFVGKSMAEAREQATPALMGYYRALSRVGSPGRPGGEIPDDYSFYPLFGEDGFDPDMDPESFMRFLFDECTIVGDAAFCRDKLVELQERCGLDHLLAWQNFGNMPHELSMASQRRLIEEVAPSFS